MRSTTIPVIILRLPATATTISSYFFARLPNQQRGISRRGIRRHGYIHHDCVCLELEQEFDLPALRPPTAHHRVQLSLKLIHASAGSDRPEKILSQHSRPRQPGENRFLRVVGNDLALGIQSYEAERQLVGGGIIQPINIFDRFRELIPYASQAKAIRYGVNPIALAYHPPAPRTRNRSFQQSLVHRDSRPILRFTHTIRNRYFPGSRALQGVVRRAQPSLCYTKKPISPTYLGELPSMSRMLSLIVFSIALLSSAAAQDTWQLDPLHSSAQFSVRHLGVSTVRGAFTKVSGTVQYDPNNLAKSSLQATIETASVDTRVEMRDNDLRSPRFLDAQKFPTINFTSKKVEAAGTGKLKVTGDLTIHGVTKEVVLDVDGPTPAIKDPMGKDRLRAGASATTKIDRNDFGVSGLPGAVGNEITITLDIEMLKPDTK
jgi:polyisoprenoid-binding protein YceI